MPFKKGEQEEIIIIFLGVVNVFISVFDLVIHVFGASWSPRRDIGQLAPNFKEKRKEQIKIQLLKRPLRIHLAHAQIYSISNRFFSRDASVGV